MQDLTPAIPPAPQACRTLPSLPSAFSKSFRFCLGSLEKNTIQ